ncbi:MAG TPA: response regulator [Candidatus Mediterraneibacter surreyensis]|nr:response regulator [Candidatus Mediterraneibacter surreyensis]
MIKVLVAEDEKPLLRGIKMLVEEIDSHFTVVKCAVNGKEAIEYLSANRVDVVFTDINMPIVDGLELMKYLSAEHPETIVVVISGYNDFEYAQKAIRFGVKEYLLKPIVKEELAAILKRIEESFESSKLNLEMNRLQNAVYHVKQENIQEEKVQIAYACAGPFIKEGLKRALKSVIFGKEPMLNGLLLICFPEICIYIVLKKIRQMNVLCCLS